MFIDIPQETPAIAALYENNAKAQGFVMNFARAWAWRPDVFEGFAALRTQLAAHATLSKREQAVMVVAMASTLGDAYCSLAWGKTLAQETSAETAAALVNGTTDPSLSARDCALAEWARKITQDPNSTTQGDVDRLRAAGFSDKEVLEATVFVAFRQAFSTVNDALGVVPDEKLVATVPAPVREAVDYGRQPARPFT
jgi:uncharacterized peroxidase-related enzyme